MTSFILAGTPSTSLLILLCSTCPHALMMAARQVLLV
jgi:hypothetical protein